MPEWSGFSQGAVEAGAAEAVWLRHRAVWVIMGGHDRSGRALVRAATRPEFAMTAQGLPPELRRLAAHNLMVDTVTVEVAGAFAR